MAMFRCGHLMNLNGNRRLTQYDLLEKIFLHCPWRLLLSLSSGGPHVTADRPDCGLGMVPQGKVGSIVGVHVGLLLLLCLLLLLLLSLLLLLLLLLLTGTVAAQPVINSSAASPRLALDGINWASVILLPTKLLLRVVGSHVLLCRVVLLPRAQHVSSSHLLAHLGLAAANTKRVPHFLACWLQRGLVGHWVESRESRHA